MGVHNMFAFLVALAAVNFIFAEEVNYLDPDQTEASGERPPNKVNDNPDNDEIFISSDFNNCTNYCINCRQALRCTYRGGEVRTCRGRLRYCVAGRCSFYPTNACSFE